MLVCSLMAAQAAAQGSDTRDIRPGEVRHQDIDLEAHEFLRLIVEQVGVDVRLELSSPALEKIAAVDSPNGQFGPEELVVITKTRGVHRLTIIASDEESAGSYRVRVVERRKADDDARLYVEADRGYHKYRKNIRRDPTTAANGLIAVTQNWRQLQQPRREADALIPLCRAERRRGQLLAAAAACERAAHWYRVLGAERRLAIALLNSGFVNTLLGEDRRAVTMLEEALQLSQKYDNKSIISQALSRLGLLYHRMGRTDQALDVLVQAQQQSRQANDLLAEALALTETANVLRAVQQSDRALAHFERALRIYRSLDSQQNIVTVLNGIADTHLREDDPVAARVAAEEAIAAAVKLKDVQQKIFALFSIGHVLRQLNDTDGAISAFSNSLKLAEEIADYKSQPSILIALAYMTAQKDPQRGLAIYQKALEQLAKRPNPAASVIAEARSAETLAKLGHLDEAWERIASALENVEALRNTTTRNDFRRSYLSFRQEYFEIAIHILAQLHLREPTAGWAEQALKAQDQRLARELLDEFTQGRMDTPETQRLTAELRKQAETLTEARRVGKNVELRQRQASEIIAALEASRANQAKKVAPPDLDIPALWRALDPETLVLVYSLGEKQSYLWTLVDGSLTFHRMPDRSEIEVLKQQLTAGVLENWEKKAFRKISQKLGSLLLTPAQSLINDNRFKRIVIVDSGPLQTVPWGALISPGKDYYLVESHEIVRLPSLSTLLQIRQRASDNNERTVAVWADPVFSENDPRIAHRSETNESHDNPVQDQTRASTALGLTRWRRLPHSQVEAATIRQILGPERVTIFEGLAANRSSFLGQKLTHSVLHFATHAALLPENELSGLVLSLVDPSGNFADGYIRAFEISTAEINADLVVLSACETGVSRAAPDGEPLGLVHAFLNAGARRVIGTLWPVRDQPSATMMEGFYKALSTGTSLSTALQIAQRKMIDADFSPRDWAGYFLQGDWAHQGPPQNDTNKE